MSKGTNIEIKGLDKLQKSLYKKEKELVKEVGYAVQEGLEQITKDIEKSLKTISHGRRYGNHIASKPGDSPNTWTGELLNSVDFKFNPRKTEGLAGSFGTKYAKYLERGTSKMAPRPFVRRAYLENKEAIIINIIDAIGKGLQE